MLVVRGLDENADEEMLRYEFSKHAPIKVLCLINVFTDTMLLSVLSNNWLLINRTSVLSGINSPMFLGDLHFCIFIR